MQSIIWYPLGYRTWTQFLKGSSVRDCPLSQHFLFTDNWTSDEPRTGRFRYVHPYVWHEISMTSFFLVYKTENEASFLPWVCFFLLEAPSILEIFLRLIFWQALPPKTKKLKKKWNILECSKKNESHKEIDLDGTVRNLEKKLNLSWICSEHTDLNDFWFVWDLETLKNQKIDLGKDLGRDLGRDFKGYFSIGERYYKIMILDLGRLLPLLMTSLLRKSIQSFRSKKILIWKYHRDF